MKKKLLLLTTAAALFAAAVAPQASHALSDDEKKKLAGALVGIAIASKLKEVQEDKKAGGEPYVAAKNVRCVPEVRKCYWNGVYSSRWTQHEF